MRRRKRLTRKGRSRFPKRRDPDYMEWLGERIEMGARCDACGARRARHRAHLVPKGRGGYDRDNVVLLCAECHMQQEKRTGAFVEETGVDLWTIARRHTGRYVAEETVAQQPHRLTEPYPR